jgi:hypothetical protein
VQRCGAARLTALITQKDTTRHSRAAARWLRRWLEQTTDATIPQRCACRRVAARARRRHHGQALATLRSAAKASQKR